MDYLWDAIFKMAAIKISEIKFLPITQLLVLRQDFSVLSHVFMHENPMMTLKNPYDPLLTRNSWLTRNSKWLPLKPAGIKLISPWAQYNPPVDPPGAYETYLILLLGSIPT